MVVRIHKQKPTLLNIFKINMNIQFESIFKRFAVSRLFVDEAFNEARYSDVLELSVRNEFISTTRNLVFCLVENEVGGLIGYLSLLTSSAVPLMLNSSISSEQLQTLIH